MPGYTVTVNTTTRYFCNEREANNYAREYGGYIQPATFPFYEVSLEYLDLKPTYPEMRDDLKCFPQRYEAEQYIDQNKGKLILRDRYYTNRFQINTVLPLPPIYSSPSRRMIRASSQVQPRGIFRGPSIIPIVPFRGPPIPMVPSVPVMPLVPVTPVASAVSQVNLSSLNKQRLDILIQYENEIRSAFDDVSLEYSQLFKQKSFYQEIIARPDVLTRYLENPENRGLKLDFQKCIINSLEGLQYWPAIIDYPSRLDKFSNCLSQASLNNLQKFRLNIRLIDAVQNLRNVLTNIAVITLGDFKDRVKSIFRPLAEQITFRDWESKDRLNKGLSLDRNHLNFRNRLVMYNKDIQNLYNIVSAINQDRGSRVPANLIPLITRQELERVINDIDTTITSSPHYG